MNFTSMGSCAGRPEMKASSACPCDSPAVQNFSIGADTLAYACFWLDKNKQFICLCALRPASRFRWDLLEQVGTALLQIRSRNGLRGVGQCPGYYAECPPCVAGIVSARFLFRQGKWASESAPQSPGGHDQGRRCAPPFPQTRG